jgi:hypothetical protein
MFVLATLSETGQIILVSALVGWVGPSLLVAWHASGNGFNLIIYFVIALFVSWPLALLAEVVLGERSPVARSIRRTRET